MSCIPASQSINSVLSQVESQMEEGPVQRRGSRAYQIFPEANVTEESESDFLYQRERLPSIVVEPTDHSELESGALFCPQQCQMSKSVEEEEEEEKEVEEEEEKSSVDNIEENQQEDTGKEASFVARKSSIGPQSQLSIFRLTPPASPTPPEAAPPCPKS